MKRIAAASLIAALPFFVSAADCPEGSTPWNISVSSNADARGRDLVDYSAECDGSGQPARFTVTYTGRAGTGVDNGRVGTVTAYFVKCDDVGKNKFPERPPNPQLLPYHGNGQSGSGAVLYIEVRSRNEDKSDFTAAGCYTVDK